MIDSGVGIAPNCFHRYSEIFVQVIRQWIALKGGWELDSPWCVNIEMHNGHAEAYSEGQWKEQRVRYTPAGRAK